MEILVRTGLIKKATTKRFSVNSGVANPITNIPMGAGNYSFFALDDSKISIV